VTTASIFARIPDDPPPGWEREVPKYRVGRNVHPSPKARHFFEPPFTSVMDDSVWQYCDRAEGYKAGEVVSTTAWPAPTFQPLNYSAKKVHEFFCTQMKSRMQMSPWRDGRVQLETGLSGPATPDVRPPRPEPVRRPVA
jgi:hypothetical protein